MNKVEVTVKKEAEVVVFHNRRHVANKSPKIRQPVSIYFCLK
jgi:hypothetical protein